jgi:hypothetical protein
MCQPRDLSEEVLAAALRYPETWEDQPRGDTVVKLK